MSTTLIENNYGAARVRLMKVRRMQDRHDLKELSVGIQFEGEFESSYTAGDNRSILPADTIKNTVVALAEYFNKRYQFYGRKIVIKFYNGVGSNTTELLGGGRDKAEAETVLKRYDGNLRRVFAELSKDHAQQLKAAVARRQAGAVKP